MYQNKNKWENPSHLYVVGLQPRRLCETSQKWHYKMPVHYMFFKSVVEESWKLRGKIKLTCSKNLNLNHHFWELLLPSSLWEVRILTIYIYLDDVDFPHVEVFVRTLVVGLVFCLEVLIRLFYLAMMTLV